MHERPDIIISQDNVIYTLSRPVPEKSTGTFFLNWTKDKCVEGCNACMNACASRIFWDTVPLKKDPEKCVNCGQCLVNCKGGAINVNVSFYKEITQALDDENRTAVAMVAPAVRYSLGEFFNCPEQNVEGKIWTALKLLGFKYIWDNQFTAVLTARLEGDELLERLRKGTINTGPVLFTSCCPAWVKFVKDSYPESTGWISRCKSPINMLGTLAKTYGAEKKKISPEKMYTVAIMPCVAKKYEGLLPGTMVNGCRSIDATMDTRELAYMIRSSGLDFNKLEDGNPDSCLGKTADATVFAASGGVTETALRYVCAGLNQKPPSDILKLRNQAENVRSISFRTGNLKIRACAVYGLDKAKLILDRFRNKERPYDFVEVMACPNGCINGGGQPIHNCRPGSLPA